MKLISNIENSIQSLKNQIELEELRLSIVEAKTKSVDYSKIEKAFKKIGVEIIGGPENFYYRFADIKDYKGDLLTKEEILNNKLKIEISIKATTLKPIIDRGYNSRDASINSNRRSEKTQKIIEKLNELTGYSTNINPFSLEVESSEKSFSFPITFSI